MTIEAIRSDFALLDDWEDRYRYVIELGKALPPLPDDLRTDANKVRGCASQVWLATHLAEGPAGKTFDLKGDSDALIVRGLVAILFALYQGASPQQALAIDAQGEFAKLGLKEHLTPQRSNGFASMVDRIRRDAQAALG
jgi:cysteine desulfuration protein SufE